MSFIVFKIRTVGQNPIRLHVDDMGKTCHLFSMRTSLHEGNQVNSSFITSERAMTGSF